MCIVQERRPKHAEVMHTIELRVMTGRLDDGDTTRREVVCKLEAKDTWRREVIRGLKASHRAG